MEQERTERPLWEDLSEISRTLDSLRERIQRLQRPDPNEVATRETPSAIPRVDVGQPLVEPQQAALAPFHEILSIPFSGPEPAEVCSLAVDRLMRLLLLDRAVIFLLDPDQERLVARAARGFRADDLIECSILPGEGLTGRGFREGRPLTYDTPLGESPTDPFIFRFPVRNALALPIRAEGEVVGVLFAGRRGRPAPFTLEDLQLASVIADRVGTALAHRRLIERLGGQVNRLKELVELSARTSVRNDIQEILAIACETGCRLLRLRAAAIALLTEGGNVTVRASHGFSEETIERWRADTRSGVTGELFRDQQLVVCPDLHGRPDDPALKGLGIRALVAVPLRSRGMLVGCFYLADSRVREFAPDEVEAAQLLSALVGLAIENGQLYGEVRQAFDEITAAQDRLVRIEKARALSAMAGGVAHEFNNILAIILGKAQLILERTTEGHLREDVGVIAEAAWRAADLIRRLQGFAATRTVEEPFLLDLDTTVQEAVALTRPRWKDEAEAQGLRVEVVTDLAEGAPVFGNPVELREMLVNLILNALDAMPHGGRLTLTTRQRGDQIVLSIRDTGTGMSETVKRQLFDPFFTTRSPQRTGLGLSVVHGVVTRHRASIAVESREGEGTTFTISFSRARELHPPSVPMLVPAEQAPPAPARVLVIEDEEHICRVLVSVLGAAGHTVDSAPDGVEGLSRFEAGVYDVVITDLSMPGQSGLEVTRAVKQKAPGTPVILITGWGDFLDPDRIRESGVDLTLFKPFRNDQVLSVLADALRLRRPAE
ncbi:MAG: GAF domain-containing protein [Candidatus Rokubacteria bacterium]|nr:GAF domain-containing protein [Candidatus Rokubacteria bacterium]